MRIAFISDIHDHVWNLRAALHAIVEQGIDHLICCGDLCSPFVLNLIASQYRGPIIAVMGNNEGDWRTMSGIALQQNQQRPTNRKVQLAGQYFTTTLAGKRIAVNHYPEIARDIADSKQYDLVAFGHNHLYELKLEGTKLLLNPGTLMGYNPGAPDGQRDIPATFAVYDSDVAPDQAVSFYVVSKPWQSSDEPGEVQPFEVAIHRLPSN